MNFYYFVAAMKDPCGSRVTWAGVHILLRADDLQVAICDGPGPRDEGSVTAVANWLEQRPFQRWFYSQTAAPGIEPPGWFERECVTAGCAWFIPIAKRIAGGEKVGIEEIKAAYAANNHGRPMPCGTIAELFQTPLHGKAYLLGVVTGNAEENRDQTGWILSYLPDGSEYSEGTSLIDFRKPQHRFEGRVADASNWFGYRPSYWRQVGVEMIEEKKTSGWFIRLCHDAGCAWFVPFGERLAAKDNVPLAEITAAYSANSGGHEMPHGTFDSLFALAKTTNQPRK